MRFRRTPNIPVKRTRRPRHGFTLIEASLAIIIVGVGVLASAELLAVGTRANSEAHRLTTGLNLAANVREMAQQRTGAEILAMNGASHSPPLDARAEPIDGLDDWEQSVTVIRVSPGLITVDAGKDSDSRLLNLTVVVRYRGEDITSESWLLADTGE